MKEIKVPKIPLIRRENKYINDFFLHSYERSQGGEKTKIPGNILVHQTKWQTDGLKNENKRKLRFLFYFFI